MGLLNFKKNEITHSNIRMTIISTIIFVTNYIFGLFLIKLIFPDKFGLITLIISTIELSALLDGFRFDQLYYNRNSKNTGKELFNYGLLRVFNALLAGIISLVILGIFYHELLFDKKFIFTFFLFIINKGIVGITTVFILEATKKWQRYRYEQISLCFNIVANLTALTLAWFGWQLTALVSKYLIAAILTFAYFLWKNYNLFEISPDRSILKWYITRGIRLFPNNMVMNISTRIDDIFIGYGISQAVLGVYSRAFQFVRLPVEFFSNNFLANNYPLLLKHKDDANRIHQIIEILICACIFFISFFTLNFLSFIHWLIQYYWGEKWSLIFPISLSLIFIPFGKPALDLLQNYMIVTEKYSKVNRVFVIYGIIEIIAITVGFIFFNFWGVAIAQSVALLLGLMILLNSSAISLRILEPILTSCLLILIFLYGAYLHFPYASFWGFITRLLIGNIIVIVYFFTIHRAIIQKLFHYLKHGEWNWD